jgi:acetyl-CoA carboxylase biotin carboxyl carrier protein
MAAREKAKADKDSETNGAPEPGPLVEMARGLAEIVAEHGLSELILDTKEVTLTVRRGGGAAGAAHVAMPAMPQATMMPAMPQATMMPAPVPAAHHAPAPAAAPATAPAAVDDKSHVVTSPFVGTFYRKPNPDSPSYVSLNDKVDKGQVLCIVEAMKLMNEIEADVAGTVVGILVEDGAPVEYGQALFKIAV